MIIKLILQAEDYLVFQLYAASKNTDLRKKRLRSWILITCLSFLVALAFYMGHSMFLFYYCLVVGVAALFFYPFYERRFYKKYYRNYVLKNFQYRFGKESVLDIQKDQINTKDITSESKLFTSEIGKIQEIGSHYFIQFKIGVSLIIPKLQVPPTFLPDLQVILQNPNILVEIEPGWRWK